MPLDEAIDETLRWLAAIERPGADGQRESAAPAMSPRPQPLADPLSAREIEVLRLMAMGASNQQMADRLVVAVSTIKTHVNRIFGKLDATSRMAAVAHARELGLFLS
jgi:LuxR family maltose regulon positive regulatory protein